MSETEGVLPYADENELASAIRGAIGADDYEEVHVRFPQFDRTDGRTIRYFPKTVAEFDKLKEMPDDLLKDIGLSIWEKGHWLYPAEWYDNIPEGYLVLAIDNTVEPFTKGKTSDDRREGMLAYGFKRPIDITARVAQLWCMPKHENKVMDLDLAFDIIALCRAYGIEQMRTGIQISMGYRFPRTDEEIDAWESTVIIDEET